MARLHQVPPSGVVAAALVRRANSAFLDDEWQGTHPFDSPAGRRQLEALLQPPLRNRRPSGTPLQPFHARIPCTTSPCTSVRRKSLP